jgi:hypothetical protein
MPEREVIAEILAPGDPTSGDEALFEPGSYTNYVRFGGAPTLDEPAWEAAEHAFHERYLAVLQGDAPWADPELLRLAALLRVDHPPHHDTRPPRVAEQVVEDAVLSDIVEDLVPDYAVLVERVTGDDRPATVATVSVLFFTPTTFDGRSPLDWWADEETDRPLVRSARVIDSSPPGLFQDGRPLLPYAPRRVPDGPAPTGIYVARPYRVGDGWAWSGVLPLPRVPALRAVRARLTLERWRHRLTERRASEEDVVRARPEVLYRACCEAADAAGIE